MFTDQHLCYLDCAQKTRTPAKAKCHGTATAARAPAGGACPRGEAIALSRAGVTALS